MATGRIEARWLGGRVRKDSVRQRLSTLAKFESFFLSVSTFVKSLFFTVVVGGGGGEERWW